MLRSDPAILSLMALGIVKFDRMVDPDNDKMMNNAFLLKVVDICLDNGFQTPAFCLRDDGTFYFTDPYATIFFVRTKRPEWMPEQKRFGWYGNDDERGNTFIMITFAKTPFGIKIGFSGAHSGFGRHLRRFSNVKRNEDFTEYERGFTYSTNLKHPKYVCNTPPPRSRYDYDIDTEGIKAFLEDLETTLSYYRYCDETDEYPY